MPTIDTITGEEHMQLQTEIIDSILVVQAPDLDLDANNAEAFKGSAASLVDGYSRVVLDLNNVGFMDSAGLGAVLSVYRKVISDGGQFRVFGLSKEVRTLFDLVRMQRLFEIYPDKDSVIKASLASK